MADHPPVPVPNAPGPPHGRNAMTDPCDHVRDATDVPGWPYLCRVCGVYWKQVPPAAKQRRTARRIPRSSGPFVVSRSQSLCAVSSCRCVAVSAACRCLPGPRWRVRRAYSRARRPARLAAAACRGLPRSGRWGWTTVSATVRSSPCAVRRSWSRLTTGGTTTRSTSGALPVRLPGTHRTNTRGCVRGSAAVGCAPSGEPRTESRTRCARQDRDPRRPRLSSARRPGQFGRGLPLRAAP